MAESFPLREEARVPPLFCPLGAAAGTASRLQEDKLVTVPPVVAPAQFARGQDVGGGPSVIAAVALQAVVLALALHEGEDGVLLLGR